MHDPVRLDDVLWPMLHYTGMEASEPHLVASSDRVDEVAFAREGQRLRDRLESLDTEAPIPYRTLASGDYDEVGQLRDHVAPDETGLAIHRRSA